MAEIVLVLAILFACGIPLKCCPGELPCISLPSLVKIHQAFLIFAGTPDLRCHNYGTTLPSDAGQG